MVHYGDGRTAVRIALVDVSTGQLVAESAVAKAAEGVVSVTSMSDPGGPTLPTTVRVWDDVDPMIAWVYAQAPSTVKTWRFGKPYEFADAAEPPAATGFPRYGLERPIRQLGLPWRIVDREALAPGSGTVAQFTSEEAARAEQERLNLGQRLRAYGVPAPSPRTQLRRIAARAADRLLRHAETGAVIARTPQQAGAVLRDHAAAAFAAGHSAPPLLWQGVQVRFATGLRFGPADAAYDAPNHWCACRAAAAGFGAVLTAAGQSLRLPLQTPRQTDFLGREVYCAVASALRPPDAATTDFELSHDGGSTFHLDEDHAVAFVLDWHGVSHGDLAHEDVRLINDFGHLSTLRARTSTKSGTTTKDTQ